MLNVPKTFKDPLHNTSKVKLASFGGALCWSLKPAGDQHLAFGGGELKLLAWGFRSALSSGLWLFVEGVCCWWGKREEKSGILLPGPQRRRNSSFDYALARGLG